MKPSLSSKTTQTLFNYFFLGPAVLIFFIFVLLPFLQGIPYSFTNWNAVDSNYDYIGFKNYISLFTGQGFGKDLLNTVYYTALSVVFANTFGLIFAMGVCKSTRLNNVLRTFFFMPFAISLILAAYIWSYIYADVFSPLFNVISPLASTKWVMPGIAAISVWRDSGYCMIIFIAALQSIPHEYNEASMIDGANGIQRFFHVTLPMLIPAFTTNITLLLSWGFKVFEYPMAATAGGPGGASETIAMYAYNNIFAFFNAGLGQAAAITMTIMFAVVTLTVSRLIRSKEVEM